LAIELMRLLGGLIEQREECPSSLILPLSNCAVNRMKKQDKAPC